jgi:hypothetical protein
MRTRGTSCSLFRLLPAPQRAVAYLAAQEAVAEEAGGDVRDEVGWYHICALCQMSQHGEEAAEMANRLLRDALAHGTHGRQVSSARTALYAALAVRHAHDCPFLAETAAAYETAEANDADAPQEQDA